MPILSAHCPLAAKLYSPRTIMEYGFTNHKTSPELHAPVRCSSMLGYDYRSVNSED